MRLALLPVSPVSLALLLSIALAGCSGGGGGEPAPATNVGAGSTPATTLTQSPATPIAADDTSIPANQTTNAAGADGTAPVGTGAQPGGNTSGSVGTAPDNTAPTTSPAPPTPTSEPTWTTPTIMERLPGQTTPSDVQLDRDGNGLAVWMGEVTGLNYSRYTASTRTWSTPEQLFPGDNLAGFDLQVAATGNAVVTWLSVVNSVRSTYVRRFTPTGGWGPLETLDSETFGRPAAAIDDAGNIYVVYDHIDANFASTFFGRAAVVGGAFGAPETIAPATTRLRISDLAIANGARAALFLYDSTPIGTTSGNNHVYSTRYAGGTWSALERFDDETGHVPAARLQMNAAGNARGYWVTPSAVKHRYAAGGGAWAPVETIAYTAAGYRRSIGMNVAGEALFAASDSRGVFASRYRPGQGWGAFVPVFERSGFTGTLQAPRLNENGNAGLSWMHGDPGDDGVNYSTYHLWASALH